MKTSVRQQLRLLNASGRKQKIASLETSSSTQTNLLSHQHYLRFLRDQQATTMKKITTSGTSEPSAFPVGYRGYNDVSKQWYYSDEPGALRNFGVVEPVFSSTVVDQRDALITAISALMTKEQLDMPIASLGGMSPRLLLIKINDVPAL